MLKTKKTKAKTKTRMMPNTESLLPNKGDWVIIYSYVVLIFLTILSEDEFSAIAWDSGGVTTGPVTVPLVLAMGLSIGGELNIADGFGVLALASAFPILTVLLYGLYAQAKQRKSILTNQNEAENE